MKHCVSIIFISKSGKSYVITDCDTLCAEYGIEPLIKTLQDRDELTQNKAAFSLLKLNAVDVLIEVLKSDIPDIRLKAVKTLGLIKSYQEESCSQDIVNRVIEAISILSEDPLQSVREAVQKSLTELRI